ncbi:MAG TPA: efflux RND transporter permease subunit [Rhizomicrobium sp.]|jgi:HAE1 family hydrophobic/amphiphilic exporter-1|nr:efflux RND transporter permease subunit [Rhizomicrobium sp.]
MNISRRFIDYPVMTTLVMAALVIFGAVGYATLPVSELPNVDFPTVQVFAGLPGADPETMGSAVAAPLENAFSTIPGIDSMTSSSSQGSTRITIQFKLDRNIDGAAQDVQAAISSAIHQLPRSMPSPPTFRKVNPSDIPILFLALSSTTLPLTEVDRYADSLLARQLSTLDGVAQVNVFGAAKYAVRIQADPNKLATRGIGIDKLAAAVQSTNVNQATGALNGETDAHIIHTAGQLDDAAAFRQQIIAYSKGAPVRLGDVANVIDATDDPRQGNWWHGQRAITVAIMRQPGSNTIAVVNEVKQVLPQFRAILPAGIDLVIRHDRSDTIRASVADVQMTLMIAAALVVGVIFVFLRKVSATIIPSLALPIAVIGTFAGMSLMGYNLDNLSLMALTLSVGFVVDDAIVMLENIVRHVENGEKPYDAAVNGAREIGFTILSMTVSLAAVFIPIVFMGGVVGRLLHEFAVTIIIAILFSGVISVTLTPMLCARMLKSEKEEKHNAFYRWSENTFNRIQAGYNSSLNWSLGHKRTILGLFAASLVASGVLFVVMPQDFLPSDDTGMLRATVQAANGTSYERMVAYARHVGDIIDSDPDVEGGMVRVGSDGAGANSADISIMLKPYEDRRYNADEIARHLRKRLDDITGINVFIQNPPSIRIGGRGSRSSYQYTLQGLDIKQLQDVSTQLVDKLKTTPGFVGVNSDYDRAAPSVEVKIDRDRAAALGVTPAQIENAMGYAFGGQQISQIYAASDQYWVMLELLPQYQRNPNALNTLYITSSNGNLVPLSAVTRREVSTMPLSINHSGQVPSVTISFDLAAGYSLSDAVKGIEAASRIVEVPPTIQGSFQGTAGAFQTATANMPELLLIAIVVVYIVLGILYESFIHPLTILSGLPSAAVGALLTLFIAGLPLTLYAFVGMIMLIGIVKKNAIMMIDFALHRQRADAGVSPEQAIREAAIIRFRPIMMTTMAAMMGTLPIAFGQGVGAESRRPLGLCVAGGLLLSQLLTLYITPVIYTYLDRLSARFAARRGPAKHPHPQPAE